LCQPISPGAYSVTRACANASGEIPAKAPALARNCRRKSGKALATLAETTAELERA
jgi:hypothetical protein